MNTANGIAGNTRIDREALVKRHNPVLTSMDTLSPFSTGNGEFAFTIDTTGLQTFHEQYESGTPLGTLSNWGWHTSPNPGGYSNETFKLTDYDTHGRKVGYPYSPWNKEEITPEVKWLRGNPHRLHLGMILFRFLTAEGAPASAAAPTDICQVLDLWEGGIVSKYRLFGEEVRVETCCHPAMDMIAVRVDSELLKKGNIQVLLHFPYGTEEKQAADWTQPFAHSSVLVLKSKAQACIERTLDHDNYYVNIQWTGGGVLYEEDRHQFVLKPSENSDRLEFCCLFAPTPNEGGMPAFSETKAACRDHWASFWQSGGAVELAESKDPRAFELERRVILSQYLTAIQSGGVYPPQESGLIHNSWSGKFHLEMHWWHAAHFALWGRPQLLEKSMDWYLGIMGKACKTAETQGYKGARWPKCIDPEGINAPCYIEPFLIWQQPHPIYFANLLYRIKEEVSVLEKYKELVFETAEFMASFAWWDETGKRYVLGPPVAPAQELYDQVTTCNPAFELAYWAYGLETAQEWRSRLGLPRNEKWDHVLKHLSSLPVAGGVYTAAETVPETFDGPEYTADHPTMIAPLGMLPGMMTEVETMRRTLRKVMEVWCWPRTWGWDFPMLAMTAARLGECHTAIDLLLMTAQKNTYLTNGNCYQHNGLPVYLPGNGGLLAAVSMMASGWENGPERHAPGFPEDGSWTVRWEGLVNMP